MKKLSFLIAVAMFTTTILSGCSSKKEPTNPKESTKPKEEAKIQLTLWHDLGDNGTKWFDELNKQYQELHPNITLKAETYSTQQWIEKSVASINTDTAPDLIYNNYERVIKVQDQTKKIADLSSLINGTSDKSFLTDQDLKVSTYQNKKIIIPIQRVQAAFGVRKSWMQKVGGKFPETWDDALALAKKFNENDPDGNGQNDTYGFALEAAKPRDLVHMLDLFGFGTGVPHTIIDEKGNIVIRDDRHSQITKEFVKLFTTYNYATKDTVNYSFNEMYQAIEGGKGGMFRVGDWNVAKWDDLLKGDYELGPWPAFKAGDKRNVVISGMRGIAIPENAPNKKAAEEFAKFMLTKGAQESSLKNVGSAVRTDATIQLSEHQKFFANPKYPLIAYDFPESTYSYYTNAEEIFHKALIEAISTPNSNMDQVLEKVEKDIKAIVK